MGLNPIVRMLHSVSLAAPPRDGAAWGLRVISREREHNGITFHRCPLGVEPFNEILNILPGLFSFVVHVPSASGNISSGNRLA